MIKEINKAYEVLKDGGVILYPTDTIWGLGCDATNEEAIIKIYKIKKRSNSKALITLVNNMNMLKKITNNIPEIDITSIPTTVIYSNISGISKKLLAKDNSAAIRIANDVFCKKIINKLGKPIVSTSANISNNIHPERFSDINDEIKNNVDYIVNLRMSEKMSVPSKIIRINSKGEIINIRS